MSEHEEFFQILIDPSKKGDKAENDRLREQSCKTCGHPYAQGGSFCGDCRMKSKRGWYDRWQREIDFNMFVHGCANPVHVYSVGWIDPDSHDGRQFLDG